VAGGTDRRGAPGDLLDLLRHRRCCQRHDSADDRRRKRFSQHYDPPTITWLVLATVHDEPAVMNFVRYFSRYFRVRFTFQLTKHGGENPGKCPREVTKPAPPGCTAAATSCCARWLAA